jgi:hypothetical protein
MSTLIDKVYAARRTATPLIAISTPDPAATVAAIRQRFEEGAAKSPIPLVRWDAAQGLTALNAAGLAALTGAMGSDKDQWAGLSANPGAALGIIATLPGEVTDAADRITARGVMVFAFNLGRYCEEKPGGERGPVIQGVWNLRDAFKRDRRTLVILGPSFRWPAELANDVMTFDEPYPGTEALQQIIQKQAAEISPPVKVDAAMLDQATDAVRSLSAFSTEQIVAMSLTKDGLDIDELWERKTASIEQTDGLIVDKAKISFDQAGGLEQFKKFAGLLARGKNSPTVVVRLDEFEKAIAGIGAGNSASNGGVQNQDKLGVILRKMEDNDWPGLICVGPPGTGKSLATKALANAASKISGRRVLALEMDLGATEDSLVGGSEKKIRAVMKVLEGLAGQGRLIFVATCNRLTALPPELKRRFRLGTWMFDLPTAEEKKAVWAIQLSAYFGEAGKKMKRPDDASWTQADVRNVCDIASRLGCSLEEATQFIVPVAKSDPDAIDQLRRLADGRFLSASYAGTYKNGGTLTPAVEPATSRRARSEEDV